MWTKAPSGFELMICGSPARHSNHLAIDPICYILLPYYLSPLLKCSLNIIMYEPIFNE